VPFVFERRSLLKHLVVFAASAVSGVRKIIAADLRVRRRRPRFHIHKKKFVFHRGPSGWYWNVKHKAKQGRVAHFVKPAYKFRHSAEHTKQKVGRTVVFRLGRVCGAGHLKTKNLQPLHPDGFQAFQKPRDRLNVVAYSDGIEQYALDTWRQDRRNEAIAALKVGVSYSELREPLNIRLLDLLAGLLVRTGRDAELRELTPILERELAKVATVLEENEPTSSVDEDLSDPKRKVRLQARSAKRRHQKFQTYQAALQKRLQNWTEVSSWHNSWSANSLHKWNGLAI
jgi:hypothetical protein